MKPKEKYRELCKIEKSIPIFSRDWWLDTVCGKDNWDVLLFEDKERIIASFPYYQRGKSVITMPLYTQTMGPWFAPTSEDTKYASALADRQQIALEFANKLNRYPIFLQNFHYSITDWLPFFWHNFKQTTRYTYILENIKQTDKLWEGMSAGMRRNITKSQEKYKIKVKQEVPVEDFIHTYISTFNRQNIKPAHIDVLRKVIATCIQRNQGKLFGGYDENGELHAAAFIAWQDGTAYYLAGGTNPLMRESRAQSLVLWNAIITVSVNADTFDFEGSMIQGVERFFRDFGATQKPYFTIYRGKLSLIHRAWLKLRRM